MTSKRNLKFLDVALAASKLSNIHKYKIGATISVGKEIISTSFNQAKSHPIQKHYNKKRDKTAHEWSYLHAELSAILKVKNKEQLRGATIFVARTKQDGNSGMARPCAACMQAIIDSGIKKIVYTTEDGVAEEKVFFV